MGLHLVKVTIEKHHQGQVFVHSKEGEGSTFGFRLPINLPKEEVEEYIPVSKLPAAARSLYQVEDGKYNKYYTVSQLGLNGLPVENSESVK